jgi:mannose-1-phosphate guanylyltransferase
MPKANHYGLIMAGGRGTRFWPRSRRRNAKQVLRFFGKRSLIQETLDRLRPLIPPERIWVLTNDYLRTEIARQLPEVPKRQIIAEPAQRNTAPCIGLAAHILRSIDPDAVMGVFPADHVVSKPARYRRLLTPAFREADRGRIAVLGMQPRWPETGYGYIEFPEGVRPGSLAALPVRQFREKPDLETAREFLAAGRFYWNAGMFFWRAEVYLDVLRQFLPRTASLLAALPPFSSRRFAGALAKTYPLCENVSVDYAVMEKASGVTGLASDDVGWNDVGSWNAVYELLPRDAQDNVTRGDALLEASRGNYVESQSRLIALLGVENLVVVDTLDALLIADRSCSQQVGNIVKLLEKQRRDGLL